MIESNGHKILHFEHLVHHKNLDSILKNGILSHNRAYKLGLISNDISMEEVQEIRSKKNINVNGKIYGLHDLVSFYFNTKNPMLYKRKSIQHELVIILIKSDILKIEITEERFSIFSDGNAGSSDTKFYQGVYGIENLDTKLIFGPSWNNENDFIKKENKRKDVPKS